jgi:hypothetical protein
VRGPAVTAPERLVEWMENNGHDGPSAAELFEVVPTYISMLRNGRVTPSLKLATRIEKLTGIECSAWMAE